jgi:hypothetical protein
VAALSKDISKSSFSVDSGTVSGVGCSTCNIVIKPTMYVGVYFYKKSDKWYVDSELSWSGSLDFDFKFGLEDPRIDVSTSAQETVYTGSATSFTSNGFTLTLTPKTTLTLDATASIEATGTLTVDSKADATSTFKSTLSGTAETLKTAISGQNTIGSPELTNTNFDITSGGSTVKMTMTPRIDITFTFSTGIPWFELISFVEFPVITTLDVDAVTASGGDCTAQLDADVTAGLTCVPPSPRVF